MPVAHSTTLLPKLSLKPGRWTVGSAATCSYQIAGEGVRPRHALLLCGGHASVLKAWDTQTWHNGQLVRGEVRLQPGDHVTFGTVECEIEPNLASPPVASVTTPVVAIAERAKIIEPAPEPETWELEQLRGQIQSLRDELSQRVIRRTGALVEPPTTPVATPSEVVDLSARVAELEKALDDARSESERLQHELADSQQQHAQQSNELRNQADELRESFATAQQQLEEAQQELLFVRTTQAERDQSWQQQTLDESAELAAERELWREELTAAETAHQQAMLDWQQQLAAAMDEVAQWKTKYESLRTGWQIQQTAWNEERTQLKGETQQLTDAIQQTLQAATQREQELVEEARLLDEQRQQFLTEKQDREQNLGSLADERRLIEHQAQELAAKFETHALQLAEFEQQQATLDREKKTLEHSWGWLQADRRKLVEEKEAWSQDRSRWQVDQERLAAETERLAADRQQFETERSAWEAQRQQADAEILSAPQTAEAQSDSPRNLLMRPSELTSPDSRLSAMSMLSDAWNIGVDLTAPRETLASDAESHRTSTDESLMTAAPAVSDQPLESSELWPRSLEVDPSIASGLQDFTANSLEEARDSSQENLSTSSSDPSVDSPPYTELRFVDDQPTSKAQPLNEAAEEEPSAPPPPQHTGILESLEFSEDEDIDDSVSRYMQELLARTQPGGGQNSSPASPVKKPEPRRESSVAKLPNPISIPNGPSHPQIDLTNGSISDSTRVAMAKAISGSSPALRLTPAHPQDKDALRAATEQMRQLANQQTVKNVADANWKQIKQSIKLKLVLAGISFSLSAGLLLWGYQNERPEFLSLGLCASGLGVMTWLDLILAIRTARQRMAQLAGHKPPPPASAP